MQENTCPTLHIEENEIEYKNRSALDSESEFFKKVNLLSIHDSRITLGFLAVHLDNVPNIENLYIGACQYIKPKTVSEHQDHLISELNLKLQELKDISIFEVEISWKDLSLILNNTPELEKLSIKTCKGLYDFDELDLKEIKLYELNELLIEDSYLSNQALEILLKGAYAVESLEISYYRHLDDLHLNLQGVTLNKLKKLKLNFSNITSKSLAVLLRAAPELEEIDISNCEKLEDLTLNDLQGVNLSKLKKINSDNTKISRHVLDVIVNNKHFISTRLKNDLIFNEKAKYSASSSTETIYPKFVEQSELNRSLANHELYLSQMDTIRVIVNHGRGFGHQRVAITLMQKFRELGFKGLFDIQCDDRGFSNLKNLVSYRLKQMILGVEKATSDSIVNKQASGLGEITISSLPEREAELSPVKLVISGAYDYDDNAQERCKKFNAEAFIQLQPTDWCLGTTYIAYQDGAVINLPSASETRLSSRYNSTLSINDVEKSKKEKHIISIVKNSNAVNSQLVYGLYPSLRFNQFYDGGKGSSLEETGNLDEAKEVICIIKANKELDNSKPLILLLPQPIALDPEFIKKIKGAHFLDLSQVVFNADMYAPGDVIIAYTGHLQQVVFDYLMLHGTTLPPVIEGCNSLETCESAGRPFIHGSFITQPLKKYKVDLTKKQKLHRLASLCLETGDIKYLPELTQYMNEALIPESDLYKYHEQRKNEYLSRPDACEYALNALYSNRPELLNTKKSGQRMSLS